MDFGNKLKELRMQNGLTQQQLATQLGVTKSVISFYERQERTPSPEVLRKMAAIFRVSSDFLLDIDRLILCEEKTIKNKFRLWNELHSLFFTTYQENLILAT